MTSYELLRLALEPFLPAIQSRARHDLKTLLHSAAAGPVQILDIGGRKSPYTVGLAADITVLDVPRLTEVQQSLKLGVTTAILEDLSKTRSNIKSVVLQDMLRCTLPSAAYDGAILVEVIEHVKEDEAFMTQVARVLKPGGWVYLTTPNGDYVHNEFPNYNPDHVRHYTRAQLEQLLAQHFHGVTVVYGIKTGKHRYRGLRSIDPGHPMGAMRTMLNNLVSHIESRNLDEHPHQTAHLIAYARKK